jgi:hypothetical protein
MCIILVEFHITTPSLRFKKQQRKNDENRLFDLLEPNSMTINNNIMMTSTFLFSSNSKMQTKM